jgi:hypothetical protein
MTSLEKVLKGSTNGIDSNGNESDAAQRKKEVIIRGVLSVTVISAEDLPAVDFMGKSFCCSYIEESRNKEQNQGKILMDQEPQIALTL